MAFHVLGCAALCIAWLQVNVIPTICARFPEVHFIIGGDGPKKLLLEEMRERHQ